jgi:hypothetical protein
MPSPRTALILPKYLDRGRDERLSGGSHELVSRVAEAQTHLRHRGVNIFRCPVCRKEFRHNDEFEPACTGPNETTDDHPMTVMTFVRTEAPLRQW